MKTKEITYCAVMVALIAGLGMIPPIAITIIPVPISFQTMGIMLAGTLLGKKLGTISVIVFLLLVVAGLPLLAGGRGGFAVLVGPTAGYLISWPFCAFLVGLVIDIFKQPVKFIGYLIANVIGGSILMNLVGIIVLSYQTNLPVKQALIATLTFLPGDLIKAIIVALVAVRVSKLIKVSK
ncbi:biotin transporter BioY [Fructilactobacillus vespulae]|uniref:biotin transporter BioY n=1 Tax=Fructilactobacillus vespulae TaxID=1249630 RepID=UPI0039B5A66A